MFGIIEVHFMDGQPVGDIEDLVVLNTACNKVVADGHLEDPALVLIADGIGTGGVVTELLDQGSSDLNTFPGRVGALGNQIRRA